MRIVNFITGINSKYGKSNPAFHVDSKPYYVFASDADSDADVVWIMDHKNFKLHDESFNYELDKKVWLIRCEFGAVSGTIKWTLILKGAGKTGQQLYSDPVPRDYYKDLDSFIYYLFTTLSSGDRRELLR